MHTNTNQHKDNATLLTKQQVWGDESGNCQLQVMKAYGPKTGMSDLAVLLGGNMSQRKSETSEGQRSGLVWLDSHDIGLYVCLVNDNGNQDSCYSYRRCFGARPVLPSSVASSSNISESHTEAVANRGGPIKDPNGNLVWDDVIMFGEYPQTIVEDGLAGELERRFIENQLPKTGKIFHYDSNHDTSHHTEFDPTKPESEFAEYEYSGKKFIRMDARPYDDNSILSNGTKPNAGESYWIEVQPIEWLNDPSGTMVTRQALFAGVQFDIIERKKGCYYGDFENTSMYRYLQDYFMNEIVPSKAPKHMAGVRANDTPCPETEAKKNRTHYQEIVATGGVQDWSTRDFSAAPEKIHR